MACDSASTAQIGGRVALENGSQAMQRFRKARQSIGTFAGRSHLDEIMLC